MAFLRLRGLAAIMVVLLLGTQVHAQAPEYQLKAAILTKLAHFVDWPAAAFPAADSPLVVCVLGDDPFGPWLQYELGERVGTRPVQIRQIETAEAARECHIVFVSRSEEGRLREVLPPLRKGTALLVSDIADSREFCGQGGMVALVMEGSRLGFELNAAAAQEAGFTISSRLKRVARSTTCGGGK